MSIDQGSAPASDRAPRPPSSRIALGTSRLRSTGGLDQAQAVRFVRDAVDLGVTTFDTANIYGQGDAERALGLALAGRRDSVCLHTKVGYAMPAVVSGARALKPLLRMMTSRLPVARRASQVLRGRAANGRVEDTAALTAAARESLARLRTDHADVLYLHSPERVTEPLVRFLLDAVSSGLCRRAGVAVSHVDQAREWARTGAVSVVQVPLGLPQLSHARPVLADLGDDVEVVAREVFSGGRLFDGSWRRDQLSLLAQAGGPPVDLDSPLGYPRWLLDRLGVGHVLVGTMKLAHLRQQLEAIA